MRCQQPACLRHHKNQAFPLPCNPNTTLLRWLPLWAQLPEGFMETFQSWIIKTNFIPTRVRRRLLIQFHSELANQLKTTFLERLATLNKCLPTQRDFKRLTLSLQTERSSEACARVSSVDWGLTMCLKTGCADLSKWKDSLQICILESPTVWPQEWRLRWEESKKRRWEECCCPLPTKTWQTTKKSIATELGKITLDQSYNLKWCIELLCKVE